MLLAIRENKNWQFLHQLETILGPDKGDVTCYYCKKLNSLKHLVKTTVAESHN